MNNSKVKEILPFAQTPGAKILQYQIGIGGMINRPEDRRLLTRIDTLEFSKWQLQTIDQLPSWFDVFDVPWTCFACRGMVGSHAFFVILLIALKSARMNVSMVKIGINL